ncbi:tryptophan-rich protein tryptophan-rich antigen [Plasmodium vinckei brucechwatti]|uniref:Tryptophan-rich protein tryptophan-rich antigen n=1 Tax=Plasmodium vinckei brucechwatti TaxID=119398 RepID=A0A6V7RZ50_PLAVN|nr:tryptophan-rich protein tryptophan-rich antigen [Plasmodium vinckei brucechwatti]
MKKIYAASYISYSLFLAYVSLIDIISSASLEPTLTEKLFDDETKAWDDKTLQPQSHLNEEKSLSEENPLREEKSSWEENHLWEGISLNEENPSREESSLRGASPTNNEALRYEEKTRTIDDIIDINLWLDQLHIKWNSLIRTSREEIEEEERIKREEWNKKLLELDAEWDKFYSYIRTKKGVWLKKKSEEWNTWIKQMESKWIAYKEHIDKEIYDNMVTTSPDDIIPLVNKLKVTVEENMIQDFKKFIDKSDHNLYKWIICDWDKWKNNFMLNWSKQQWKHSEDIYWKKFSKSKSRTDPISFLIKEKFDKWVERNKTEQNQWADITGKLESKYLTAKHSEWEEWKIHKREWYGKWMAYYIENFINMRTAYRQLEQQQATY